MRKFGKLLSVVAAAAILGSAGAANADLQALGAVNPATGYPFWYQDTNGLALSLCLDQNGFCVLPGAFVYPADRTGINAANFPDESFYYMADTAGTSPGGTINLVLYEAAVEAGFIVDVVDGQQAAFTRIRIRADVTLPGTYTVTHPYGEKTFVVGAVGPGNEINDTVDVPGLVIFPFDQNHPSLSGGTPPVIPQDVGPFLRRADGVTLVDPTNPNNRYIGLPGQFVAVTGSPTGNNFVRITGPTADTLLLNTLSLMGKIVGIEADPATADFGVTKTTAPSAPLSFTVTNFTGLPATIDPLLSSNPLFTFPVAADTCSNVILNANAPGNTCTFDVVFAPVADGAASGTVTISTANAPSITVNVSGTGDGTPPTLTVGPDLFTNALQATISGTATDNVAVHDIVVSLGGVIQGTSTVTNGNWSFIVSGFILNSPNVFSVDAVDTALPAPGNTTTSTITVTHDNILPAVNLTSPVAASLINNPAPNLTFSATDTNLASTVVKVDGTIVTPTPVSLGPLADGPHTVTVDATDSASNLTTVTNAFTVDATPPAITVISPNIINGRLGVTSPALTFTVDDANPVPANTSVTLDGADVTALATLGPFTAGSAHTLVVNAMDGAGNSSTTTLPFTIVLADGRISTLGASDPVIADALLALRHAVSLITLDADQFAHGDVAPLDVNGIPNPDGVVDIADALIILRRVVGLITTF